MTARYILDYHPLVDSDLFDISMLIEQYAGQVVADRKLAEIERVTYNLRDFPHIGTIRDDLLPGLRAIPAAEKGVVCFTVDEATHTVFIMRQLCRR